AMHRPNTNCPEASRSSPPNSGEPNSSAKTSSTATPSTPAPASRNFVQGSPLASASEPAMTSYGLPASHNLQSTQMPVRGSHLGAVRCTTLYALIGWAYIVRTAILKARVRCTKLYEVRTKSERSYTFGSPKASNSERKRRSRAAPHMRLGGRVMRAVRRELWETSRGHGVATVQMAYDEKRRELRWFGADL